MADISPPPGFVFDEEPASSASAAPAPPPGFVFDDEAPSSPPLPPARPPEFQPPVDQPPPFARVPQEGNPDTPPLARPRADFILPVQPFEEVRPRTGGSFTNHIIGRDRGYLTGEEGFQEAEEKRQDARAEAARAGENARRAQGIVNEGLGAQRPEIVQRLIESGLSEAEANAEADKMDAATRQSARTIAGAESSARTAAEAAEKKVQQPTQTRARSWMETAPRAVTDQTISGVEAGARVLSMLPISGWGAQNLYDQFFDPKAAAKSEEARRAIFDRARQVASSWFAPDVARNDEIGQQIVQGIGSTAGFMATGVAGRMLGLGEKATVAIAGALPNAEEMWKRAEREEQITGQEMPARKWIAFALGAGVGSTEALPIGLLFSRLENATGGGLTKWIGSVVAQSGEEGLQEGLQGLLNNAIERGLFDPNKEITDEVAQQALVGAISGGVVGGAAHGLAGGHGGHGAEARMPALPPEAPPVRQEDFASPPGAPEAPAAEPQPSAQPEPPSAPAEASPVEDAPQPVAAPEPPRTPDARAPEEPRAPAESAPEKPSEGEVGALRGAGYSDQQIIDMTPDERLAEAEAAAEAGAPRAPVEGFDAAWESALKEAFPDSAPNLSESAQKAEETPAPQRIEGGAQIDDAERLVRENGNGSTSFLQRKLGLGYNAAATLMEELERRGVVSAPNDRGGRTVLPAAGTRSAPVHAQTAADVQRAGAAANVNPTPAQAAAGNYAKGHVQVQGLNISIENPAGSVRRSKNPADAWESPPLAASYGYIKGTQGRDKDHIDTYVGPNPQSQKAFIIDQMNPANERFDEHKVMLGFDDMLAAQEAYERGFSDGRGAQRVGDVTEVSLDELKKWLAKPGRRVAPFSSLARSLHRGAGGEELQEHEPPPGFVYDEDPQPAPAPPPRKKKAAAPQSLIAFLKSKGGLRPDGELRAISAHRIPGLISRKGLTLDHAREAAAEAGYYLPEDSTPADFLELLDTELRGNKQYTVADLGEVVERRETEDRKAAEEADRARLRDQAISELAVLDMTKSMIDEAALDAAVNAVYVGDETDLVDAYEKASTSEIWRDEDFRSAADAAEPTPVEWDAILPDWESVSPPDEGNGQDSQTEAAARQEAGVGPASAREEAAPDRVSEEPGAEGKPQTVIPGAEKASDKTMAQRGAEKPLRPKSSQQEPGGMFGDVQEKDLLDVAKAEKPSEGETKTFAEIVGSDSENSIPNRVARHLLKGGFKNIREARAFAGGWGLSNKQIDEVIELGVVKAAREVVDRGMDAGATFDRLLKLYGAQPNLSSRTSTSVQDQAYSTPVPLAYVASRLAGVTKETTVYEPTAGNGALLIGADPAKATVNEINADRRANLEAQGFEDVTGRDAAEPARGQGVQDKSQDVVISNPPFGPVKDEAGASKVFDMGFVQPNYKTKEIDHAIALRALEAMKDDGRAVLIIGAPNKLASDKEGAYNGKAKREFFLTLYRQYGVTDHFTVDGDLYAKQGAAWPVDVIVINGRGRSNLPLPAQKAPPVLSSWAEVRGRLPDARSEGEAGGVAGAPAEAGIGPVVDDGAPIADAGGERSSPQRAEPTGPGSVRGGRPDEQRGDRPVSPPAQGARRGRDAQRGERGRPDERARAGDGGLASEAEIGAAFDAALGEAFEAERPTAQVAKDAGAAAVESADAALAGLVQLFGGGKTVSSGLNFDEETWKAARPLFIKAAEKFGEFKDNVHELVSRMVKHMRDNLGLGYEGVKRMKPYVVRFVQEVQQGKIALAARSDTAAAPEAKPAPAAQQQGRPNEMAETSQQSAYKPKSGKGALGTLTPVNMATSTQNALSALEERVGKVDAFVAKELGYPEAKLGDYFAAEQIDSLGLAIDNLKRGRGYITGDQTGIGKGRVNAGIIRWAIQNGRTPIFFTEKPNLYGDMYRDLSAIDIKSAIGGREPSIFATNSGETIPLTEDESVVLRQPDSKKQTAALTKMAQNGDIGSHDMVFTTYAQMQTVRGEDTPRRRFMEAIAPNAILILDESHNAGGVESDRKSVNDTPDRADFIRKLVNRSKGVFYSSATYAKRPSVMGLYSKTDLRLLTGDVEGADIGELIEAGGVPLQQAVASMLARAGQYMRRERSFEGVTYDVKTSEVSRETYDAFSRSLRAVLDFSTAIQDAVKKVAEEIKEEGEVVAPDGSVGAPSVTSTNFTSVMHNLINQFLLSIKADAAANEAIEAIRNGEKPVITVANTMESFISEYAEETGLKAGDAASLTFKQALEKYLDRTRWIMIKPPFAKKGETGRRIRLTDAQIGRYGVRAYKEAQATIDAMPDDALPLSPIDFMKAKLEASGYSFGEITGRDMGLRYLPPASKGGALDLRKAEIYRRGDGERSIRGRRRAIAAFNNGQVDALLLNRAGSTGLSLHASKEFKDQRKRRMIVAQPEGNIDTHMQMLGRVHRTGQVVLPGYTQLAVSVPAEKRPAALLSKKMASLNANTTANRDSALTAKETVDFMNEVGDRVAANYLFDNPHISEALDHPVNLDSKNPDIQNAMARLTGRIPLLPIEQQEQVYEEIEEAYRQTIARLDAAGENPLEAKTLDLDAKEIASAVFQQGKPGSPFTEPVYLKTLDAKRIGNPYTTDQMVSEIAANVGLDAGKLTGSPAQKMAQIRQAGAAANKALQKSLQEDFQAYRSKTLAAIKGDDAEAVDRKVKAQTERLNSGFDRLNRLLGEVAIPGSHVRITEGKESFNAIVSRVIPPKAREGEERNPAALGRWRFEFAVANDQRVIDLSANQIGGSEDKATAQVEPAGYSDPIENTLRDMDALAKAERRAPRIVATGNIVSAFASFPNWKIVNYRNADGSLAQGVIAPPRVRSLRNAVIGKDVALATPEAVLESARNGEDVTSKDKAVVISYAPARKSFFISVPASKQTGGRYYLYKPLLDSVRPREFQKRGTRMEMEVPETMGSTVVDHIQRAGAVFTRQATDEDAKAVIAKMDNRASPPAAAQAPEEAGAVKLTREMATRVERLLEENPNNIAAQIAEIVQRVAGEGVNLELTTDKLTTSPEAVRASGGNPDVDGLTVLGKYKFQADTVFVALAAGRGLWQETAYHEAFHRLQLRGMIRPQEAKALKASAPILRRDLVQSGAAMSTVADLSLLELSAYAFDRYAAERSRGEAETGIASRLPGPVAIFFDRMARAIEAVRDLLKDAGLIRMTHSDVFRRAYEGEIGKRRQRGFDPIWAIKSDNLFEVAVPPRDAASTGFAAAAQQANQQAGYQGRTAPQPPQNAVFTPPERGALTASTRQLQEEFIDLRRTQEAIEEQTGAAIPQAQDAKLAQELYPGRISERLEDFIKGDVKELTQAMIDEKVSPSTLDLFLYAQHAPERNRVAQQRDPTLGPDDGSGMSNQAAADILQGFRNAGTYDAHERVARKVYRMLKADVQRRVSAGLMEQQQAAEWDRMFQYYVPLSGFADPELDLSGRPKRLNLPNVGRGFDLRSKEVQHFIGRRSLAASPLVNAISKAEEGIDRVEKNRVAKTLLRMVQAYPNKEVWEVDRKATRKVYSEKTGKVHRVPEETKVAENVFVAKVGGTSYHITLHDPDMAKAFRNMGNSGMHAFMKGMAQFSRFFSQLQTSRNPEFFIPNAVRDFQEAYMALKAMEDISGRKGLARAFAKRWPRSLAVAAREAVGRPTQNARWRRLVDDWRRGGGKMSFNAFRGADEVATDVFRELRRVLPIHKRVAAGVRQEGAAYIPNAIINSVPARIIGAVNDTMENTTRLAVYAALRETGGFTIDKAASGAREATVNFNRRGAMGPAINALYAFYNASIQGNAVALRRIMKSRRFRIAYASLIPISSLLTALNYAAGGGDDEEKSAYMKIPQWERDSNIILPIGLVKKAFDPSAWGSSFIKEVQNAKGERVRYVKIPLAFGLKLPWLVGENAATVFMGAQTPGKAAWNVMAGTLDTFNPVGRSSTMGVFFPTLMKPIYELGANEDWRGREIVPGRKSWNEGTPRSSQYHRGTHPFFVQVADLLNRASGGDRFKAGAVDLYPEHFEYTVGWLTGGLGRFTQGAAGAAMNAWEGVETPLNKLPIMRRFLGETGPEAEGAAYFESKQDLQGSKNRLNAANRALKANPDDAEALRAYEREAEALGIKGNPTGRTDWTDSAAKVFTATDKAIRELRTEIEGIRTNRNLPAGERDFQIREKQREIETLQRDARKSAKDMAPPKAR